MPWLKGIGEEYLHDQLAEVVLPYAQRMWADLQNPDRGRAKFKHDHYLKMWALTEPVISGQFLLLDEAQDTNPVVERVFNAQRGHAQLVMVGDSGQAIYGWRGARDVMNVPPCSPIRGWPASASRQSSGPSRCQISSAVRCRLSRSG